MNFLGTSIRSASRAAAALQQIAPCVRADDPAIDSWCRDYYQDHKERLTYDLMLCLKHFPPGSSILEIGCMPPFVTGALAALGFSVTGIDLAPERFSTAIAALDVHVEKCDIERDSLPFADGAFPCVLMNEIFEHLRIDLIFTLEEVFRVLEPGGVLLMSTPNLLSYRGLLNLLISRRAFAICGNPFKEFRKLSWLGHMGHVREYTVREVVDFMESIGFQRKAVVYRGSPESRAEQVVGSIVPALRPFFSALFEKPRAKANALGS